jgi:hypothetical protein
MIRIPTAVDIATRKIVDLEHHAFWAKPEIAPGLLAEAARIRRRLGYLRLIEGRDAVSQGGGEGR